MLQVRARVHNVLFSSLIIPPLTSNLTDYTLNAEVEVTQPDLEVLSSSSIVALLKLVSHGGFSSSMRLY